MRIVLGQRIMVTMELLSEGRDADVYALDDARVLHRRRTGSPPDWIVDLTAHVRVHGVPTPAILDIDGRDIVYERVHGRSLMDDLAGHPWRVHRHARTLASVHRRVHAVPALDQLPRVGAGDRLLHLDLHPDNVLLEREGPVVIDWTNAAAGNGPQDIALTWVLLTSAPLPVSGPSRWLLTAARTPFLRAFLHHADRGTARAELDFAIDYRLRDPSIDATERSAVERFRDARRATRPA